MIAEAIILEGLLSFSDSFIQFTVGGNRSQL